MTGSHGGICAACRKRTYVNGRAARAVSKKIPGRHLSAYRCPQGAGWHLGHLPIDVVHGDLSKDDYYVRREEHARRRTGGAQ